MRTPLAALLALLVLAPAAGAVPSDLMLCLHRDGRVAVEPFQKLCCKAACPPDGDACPEGACPSECPDDQCDDVPLTLGPDVALQGTPEFPAPPPFLDLPVVERPTSHGASAPADPAPATRALGPPTRSHLRTVVLRS